MILTVVNFRFNITAIINNNINNKSEGSNIYKNQVKAVTTRHQRPAKLALVSMRTLTN